MRRSVADPARGTSLLQKISIQTSPCIKFRTLQGLLCAGGRLGRRGRLRDCIHRGEFRSKTEYCLHVTPHGTYGTSHTSKMHGPSASWTSRTYLGRLHQRSSDRDEHDEALDTRIFPDAHRRKLILGIADQSQFPALPRRRRLSTERPSPKTDAGASSLSEPDDASRRTPATTTSPFMNLVFDRCR